MTEYDVWITLGNKYAADARVRIETEDRGLLDLLQQAIKETYDRWYKGEKAQQGALKYE